MEWLFSTNSFIKCVKKPCVCVLLRTEAEDEDEGEDENGHRCTPEAEQWDVLADGWDGGVDLQVRQVSRPLLGAAAWVGAHALRHVAVERVGIARLLYIITRWHLSEKYECELNDCCYNLQKISSPQYKEIHRIFTHTAMRKIIWTNRQNLRCTSDSSNCLCL